jgi:hypothetical protein
MVTWNVSNIHVNVDLVKIEVLQKRIKYGVKSAIIKVMS